MSTSLRQHFYNASDPECSSGTNVYKPAASYEIRYNIFGIAADYNYPENMTATEFEKSNVYSGYVFACYKEINIENNEFNIELIAKPDQRVMDYFERTWAELKQLNPQLNKIDIDQDSPLELVHAVNGVACQLNTDDIAFYIQIMRETNRMDVFEQAFNDSDFQAACKVWAGVTGATQYVDFEWLPHPKTILKMAEKIKFNLDNDPEYENSQHSPRAP